MADMHEVTFSWPEVDANTVIVTGTFDQWSSSLPLTKTAGGFEGKAKVPWGERVLYKFVVDGRWVTARSQPEEPDDSGNLNNVYECPSKPEPSAAQAALSAHTSETLAPKDVEVEESAAVPPAPSTEQDDPPENASQAAQPVEDTAVTSSNGITLPSKSKPSAVQAASFDHTEPLKLKPDEVKESAAAPVSSTEHDTLPDKAPQAAQQDKDTVLTSTNEVTQPSKPEPSVDAASSDHISETVEPETVEPETVEPETVEPETVEPETVEPKHDEVEESPAATPASSTEHDTPPEKASQAAHQDEDTILTSTNEVTQPSKPEQSVDAASSDHISETVEPETVEPKHDEVEESPAATTASSTEHDTSPENASQAAQQDKDTVVTSTNGVTPEIIGSAVDQVHTAGDGVPPVLPGTAQKVSEANGFTADRAQPSVAQDVVPAAQAVQDDVTETTPVQVEEPVNASSEATQAKELDPLNPDKIYAAAPTPSHDVDITNSLVESASQTPSQPVVESEPIPESSDVDTVPAVTAVLPTTPNSAPTETQPITPILQTAAAPAETDVSPSFVTVVQAISDVPPEASVVDHPVANGTSPKEPLNEEPASILTRDEETVVSEIPTATESAPIVPGPPTSDGADTEPAPLVETHAKASDEITTEAPAPTPAPTFTEPTEPADLATSTQVEPVQTETERVEHMPSTSDALPTAVSPPTHAPATVDTQATAPTPDVTEAKPDTTTTPPQTVVSTAPSANPTQKAPPSPSPDKETNGHPVAAAPTPNKEAVSDLSSPEAFATVSSATSSHTTSKPGSARKKRMSIFGKVKQLFFPGKEEKKGKNLKEKK